MEQVVQIISQIGSTVSGWLNLTIEPLYVGIGALALALILVIAIIVIIAVSAKKAKAKKTQKAKKQESAPVVEEVQPEPVAEPTPVVEEVQPEPVVEPTPVVEEIQPEPVAEPTPVVEEVQPEPVVEPAPVLENPAPVENTPKKKKKAPVEPAPKRTLNGKWTVKVKAQNEYVAFLSASNGEVMLCSETYTTEEGARKGIATIINGVENGNFIIYSDKNKNYYYKLKTAGNRLLCVGEIYKSKDQCLKAVETVKRIAKGSIINDELVEGEKYAVYVPAELDVSSVKKGQAGKWRIEITEEGKYTAHLYANNGQLMLATEEVAVEKSVKNAIESVKKNSALGNFIIDRDKFGRFYYKLRNAQKSVICIGEAYDTLEACQSAIESVRRFAATAVLEQ